MVRQPLQRPSPELVRTYLRQFEEDAQASVTDRALHTLFEQYPRNDNLEHVLLKATALNSLYFTNIFGIYQAARHIHNLSIDEDLEAGSLDLVGRIARMRISDSEKYNYSFASKYCSWHRQEIYPIYDSIVVERLIRYKAETGFCMFTKQSLLDYSTYKQVIETFREHFGLLEFTLREIDKFLWMYGRPDRNSRR